MNSDTGCYFVDGSHLFASIERVKHDHPELSDSKLNVQKLTQYLMDEFGGNISSAIRVIYYFKKGDDRIPRLLTIPSLHGQDGHWQIKECGYNLKGANLIPTAELEKLDPKYRDIYPRGEKGVDMELACDALAFAANGAVKSFVFVINDRDYIPLFHAIQRFGANTYVAGLDVRHRIQDSILNIADSYKTLEAHLNEIFDYSPPVVEATKE